MHRRVVVIVAGALFALLAFVAAMVTDLHDQEYPRAIDTESRLGLDFSESQLTDTEAFAKLIELDGTLNLGLLKVAPDLAGDGDGQVFAALDDGRLPAEFRWFGDRVAKVVGKERLANSYATGSYLVTGDIARLGEFEAAMAGAGVKVNRRDASIADTLDFVVWESRFSAAVIAAFALIVALALFWLSMKARGRALRVLGGSPVVRIQVQDLRGFLGALLVSAVIVALVAAGYVGVAHGWVYVEPFLTALAGLELAVIGASALAALVMSASAWPSATMLATRQPAVRSLRTAAVLVQALTFLLVVSAAGPAWSAYRQSSATAAEMAQWKQLADQVSISFAMNEVEMERVEPEIGALVREAESLDTVALSYTFADQARPRGLTEFSAVTLVNRRWLDMVTRGVARPALDPVPHERVRENVEGLGETLALWSRTGASGAEILDGFRFFEPADGLRLPVSNGGAGNSLSFLDDVLVAVVPSLHDMANDRNLTSMASTGNIVFTGVAATQRLLERHGLSRQALQERGFTGAVRAVYVAEEGILRAQFTAYVVWLLNLALIALVTAFAVATAISALITALLRARRDFPLRVAGRSWALILRSRVAKELLAGVVLAAVVSLFQAPGATGAVLVVAALGLLLVPLSHLLAARWCFAGVSRRRM